MRRNFLWRNRHCEDAVKLLQDRSDPYKSESELLETARVLFELRSLIRHGCLEEEIEDAPVLERKVRKLLHRRLRLTGPDFPLAEKLKGRRYSRFEIEVVLLLILSSLGMSDSICDVDDIQKAMLEDSKGALSIIRTLSENGRLNRSGLIKSSSEALPKEMKVEIGLDLIDAAVHPRGGQEYWKVRTQSQFIEKCAPLFGLFKEKSEQMDMSSIRHHFGDDLEQIERNIGRQTGLVKATLEKHPQWPLHALLANRIDHSRLHILLSLLAKAVGAIDSSDELFTGGGLARVISSELIKVQQNLKYLRQTDLLRASEYVQVCGGYGDALAVEDEGTLMSCEFELTDEFLEKIKVKRIRSRNDGKARKPKVRMKQLVHTEETVSAIRIALVQARHGKVLMEDWGLAGTVPYGRSISVLFTGPPGVGKTATAEAMAHELGKQILIANYAEIQNCFVGQTEKNISRIFRSAKESDAILFWDEADSMFYDRDSAYRNWEVREVNQLLMELERFEGLCILATNRTVTLDKALERRIAIKVAFSPPDASMRRQIWCKLIPRKLPLADIDWQQLSASDLTGGEIKNAVLNAARFALSRGPEGPVTMVDFEKAVSMEIEGRWGEGETAIAGFKPAR